MDMAERAVRRLDLERAAQRDDLAARVRSVAWLIAEATAAAVLAREPIPHDVVDAERALSAWATRLHLRSR